MYDYKNGYTTNVINWNVVTTYAEYQRHTTNPNGLSIYTIPANRGV
jgi:hypothetical protein